MAAPMKVVGTHKGYNIYMSAATHPLAKTRSLTVAISISDTHSPKFRYKVFDPYGFTQAYNECVAYIEIKTP